MGVLLKKIKSYLRYKLNTVRKVYVKDPLIQKKLSVLFNNFMSLIDCRNCYEKEVLDYKKIINGKHYFYCDDYYMGNHHFGTSKILRDYANYSMKINACIEHGVYFGDYICEAEAFKSGLNGIITFGDKRLRCLEKIADVPIITIGPYIYYAQAILTEKEIVNLKNQHGKTLLVFPTHSIDRVESDYNISEFINYVLNLKKEKKFNKILICMFYNDILLGKHIYYENKGFTVVTAGFRGDPLFLSRLKTLILLSDYTVSNDVGTHVGYCCLLGKHHTIFSQEVKFKPTISEDLENITSTFEDSVGYDTDIVRQAFSTYRECFTERQLTVLRDYWGIDCIKSPTEMYDLLKNLDN